MWLLDRGIVPDVGIRLGIRRLLEARLGELAGRSEEDEARYRADLDASPIALNTRDANDQHYEVPASFFELCLGPRLKYSAGLWPEGVTTLLESEIAALRRAADVAELSDGQDVLELGCGWGSLTLFMAENLPRSRIVAVSNSASQRAFILERARERGLNNIDIITADMNDFDPGGRRFDRVVSVEMFEHMRNYRRLTGRIARWIKPGGKLFVHIFTHKDRSYLFEDRGPNDWMARHFFTGGQMPSRDLLPALAEGWVLEEQTPISGRHYAATAEAWLSKLDRNRSKALAVLRSVYGDQARVVLRRWRVFFMACAELWGYDDGETWGVTHYRFRAATEEERA